MDSDLVCAVSSDLYNNGAGCGNYYTLTYNGNSVTVKVVDLCPGCPSPGFDLSSGAFQQLAPLSDGVIDCDYTQYDTFSQLLPFPKLLTTKLGHRGRWMVLEWVLRPVCKLIQTRVQFASPKFCLTYECGWRNYQVQVA